MERQVAWHCSVDNVPTTVISLWTVIAKHADHGVAEWEALAWNMHAINKSFLDTLTFSHSEERAKFLLP